MQKGRDKFHVRVGRQTPITETSFQVAPPLFILTRSIMRSLITALVGLVALSGCAASPAASADAQCASPSAMEHDAHHRIMFYAELVKLTSEGNYAALRQRCERAYELCETKLFSFIDVCLFVKYMH